MTKLQEAQTLFRQMENVMNKASAVLDRFPVGRYVELIGDYPEVTDFNYVSPEVKGYSDAILKEYGPNTMEHYNKLLLLALIIQTLERLSGTDYPENVKTLFLKNFERIIADLELDEPVDTYLSPSGRFFKKLALCSQRLIPVGARKINQSRLPIKEFMFRKGTRQFFELMLFVAFELRGIEPMYIGHLDTSDPDLVSELNEAGLKRAYLRIVELMKVNTKIKGYFGTSWMLDPQLNRINRRHSYSREIVTRNGGKLYYKGPSQEALKNALVNSTTRKRLYEEGKYIPTDYVIVWPRKKLLQWAEKQVTS